MDAERQQCANCRNSFWKGLGTGMALASATIVLMAVLSGCAASQGYHRYDSEDGYPARPGNGSAVFQYQNPAGPGYGSVNGTTTTPEIAVEMISRAQRRDAETWVITECYRRYGWRCNMYGSTGRYAPPGYLVGNLSGGASANAQSASSSATTGREGAAAASTVRTSTVSAPRAGASPRSGTPRRATMRRATSCQCPPCR